MIKNKDFSKYPEVGKVKNYLKRLKNYSALIENKKVFRIQSITPLMSNQIKEINKIDINMKVELREVKKKFIYGKKFLVTNISITKIQYR